MMTRQAALERWATACPGLRKLENSDYLQIVVEGLGQMALDLDELDARVGASSIIDRCQPDFPDLLRRHQTESFLWVLGAYEVIRTVSQRARETPTALSESAATTLAAIKRKFERVRVPLAKLEKANRAEASDFAITYPVSHPTLGVAWQLGPEAFVTRHQLAEDFLSTLEIIATDR